MKATLNIPKNIKGLEKKYRDILTAVGEDPMREGLVNTPRRNLKFLHEFCHPKPFICTTFKNDGTSEMIIQRKIPFQSLCEHHLIPFAGEAIVAYIPTKKIVGLSKLARTIEFFARRFQNQERICLQSASFLQEKLNASGVAIVLIGRHNCMEMRGIRQCGAETITMEMLGEFKTNARIRNEFFQLINYNTK